MLNFLYAQPEHLKVLIKPNEEDCASETEMKYRNPHVNSTAFVLDLVDQ